MAIRWALLTCAAIFSTSIACADPPPIIPRETTVLFNGRDLSGFYTWLGKHGRDDPDRVFTVVDQIDGAPAIRMSGQHFGGFKLGKIAWRHVDPDFKPVLNFRGRNDVERPLGQWNRIEAICAGGDVTYFLNDVKVNEGRNGSFREGRLLFQSEGAEIFYRRILLHPLK